MITRFDRIHEGDRQTDGQAGRQTDRQTPPRRHRPRLCMALTRPSLTTPWTSSRMCADKKRTLRATILTIFSQRLSFCEMWQDFLDFFWKSPQIRTSNFCKVVRQHTVGMMGSIMWILLEIYFAFSSKKIENPLRIDKVIVTSLVYYLVNVM